MRGDILWPTLIWLLVVGVLSWWSPQFGKAEPPEPAVKDCLTVESATHQKTKQIRRDTTTINPPPPYIPRPGSWK